MWITVEEANIEQLVKEAFLSEHDEITDFLVLRLGEFNSVNPLGDQHSSSAVVHVDLWGVNSFSSVCYQLLKFDLVLCLINEIELSVETFSPSFKERNIIRLVSWNKSLNNTLEEFRKPPEYIHIFRD